MLSWSLNDVVLRLKFLSLSYLFFISLDFPSLSSSFIISNSKMDIRKEYTILNSITNCTICKFFISKIFFHMPRKITHPFDKEHAFFFFRSSAELKPAYVGVQRLILRRLQVMRHWSTHSSCHRAIWIPLWSHEFQNLFIFYFKIQSDRVLMRFNGQT